MAVDGRPVVIEDLVRAAQEQARMGGRGYFDAGDVVRAVLPSLKSEARRRARALLRSHSGRGSGPVAAGDASSPLPTYDASVLLRRLAEHAPVTAEGVVAAAMEGVKAEQPVTTATDPSQVLGREIVGQREAVAAIASALLIRRAGLRAPDSPAAVMLFLGPPGTGKTHAARRIAVWLAGSAECGENLVRLDMSEFSESFTVSRLIGAPPGYVGYESGGQLTEALLREPGSVVLLDEIEKAHPAALNLLLQVFSGGRITDARKRVVDCSRAIFIMTTNLGWSGTRDDLGFRTGRRAPVSADHARGALTRFLSPEFVNRIDAIVPFNALDREALREIVNRELERLRQVAAKRSLPVEVDHATVERILDRVEACPDSGARVVRRIVEEVVARPLAARLLGVRDEQGGGGR